MERNICSKGSTTYNEFVSAIKSSKVDGEIDEKKLLQNCINCHNQVKSAVSSNELESLSKFEEFRLNSTILLLLGCPSINELPEISVCNELMPLIKSIPVLDVDKALVVWKGLKNNKYLRGVLPWLPTEILVELLSKFLNKSKTPTPLSLAISFEIFYGLVYSSQYDNTEKESISLCMRNFVDYLKRNENFSNSSKNKLMAYYFMYIVECIHILIKYLDMKNIDEPNTFSFGLKFKVLKNNLNKSIDLEYESTVKHCINILTSILNKMVLCISSDTWISWHEAKAPTFGLETPNQVELVGDKSLEKSIQLQIAHTIYSILKISNKISGTEDILNQIVNKELSIFLKQVSVDPDYDSDNDLSNTELIDAMKQADKTKNKKLITILLNRDDIFEVKECLDFLRHINSNVPKPVAFAFMKKFILLLKENYKCSEDWKYVALELSTYITNEDVRFILKEDLNCGRCDIMKTVSFLADFTQIFNRLSNESDKECYDAYLRLCLQSGEDVVKHSIDMVLVLPGLSSVLASAFRMINFICRSKGPDGLALTTKLLVEKWKGGLTSDSKKEFILFLVTLLEFPVEEAPPYGECPLKDLLPVDVHEIFEELICPQLKAEAEVDNNVLDVLDVLKQIMNLYPEVILESGKLLPSIMSLVLIHNNCVPLHNGNCSRTLKIRNSVENILHSIETHILKDVDNFQEKSALLRIQLSHYELHFRSIFVVSRLINNTSSGKTSKSIPGWICKSNTVVEKIFYAIMMKTRYNEDTEGTNCSRIEWIWSLFIILSQCDEKEWLCAFNLTHSFLGECNLLTPTLKIFQEVLLLLCDSVSLLSIEDGRRIALSHCFKCFSNASMKFITEKLKADENEFYSIVNIFIWWCKAQRVLECDTEYPAILLDLLVTSLGDLVRTKGVLVGTGITSTKELSFSGEESQRISSSRDTLGNMTNVEHDSYLENGSENALDTGMNSDQNARGSDTEIDKIGIELEEESNPTTQSSKKTPKSLNKKTMSSNVIPKKDYDAALESMVKVVSTCVRPSEMTSAVAGKLKALSEL